MPANCIQPSRVDLSRSVLRTLSARVCSWFVFFFLSGAGLGAEVLAFPGAEGYGRFASGGRGGVVLEVTNLNDSGEGSLRAAVEASGPRTVIFRVSGTIYLDTTLNVQNGDLTIAGQTAPGDGVCIARRGLQVNADNVIIRFIRVRLGDLYPRENNLESFESDAFECRYTDRVIIDHCSFSWSIDECATAYSNTNFTMQWCMITESLQNSFHEKGAHGYGGIWGGSNVSYHHNLLAHHTSRNPRFNGARYDDPVTWDREVDHRNNVIYNWSGNSCYGGEPNASGFQANYNIVGNYYKSGPATSSGVRDRIVEVTSLEGMVSKFHVAGNYIWGAAATTEDNWLGVDRVPEDQSEEVYAAESFLMAPLTEQVAETGFSEVLASVGASYPSRDSVDARIINEVRTGTANHGANGIIDSQDDVGGYPVLNSESPPQDSDRDGIPDDWEIENGLNPEVAEDGSTVDPLSGYTNLERYINGLVSQVYPKPKLTAGLVDGRLALRWENQSNQSEIQVSSDAVEWESDKAVESWGNLEYDLTPVNRVSLFKIRER